MREFRLIKQIREKLNLDLNGLTVLTEAASGNYVWTPIIAAAAGAKVLAFSKDSNYSPFSDVKRLTLNLAEKLNLENSINVIENLTPDIIEKADIITNLGFLRPLNEKKLKYFKKTAVIPLMWETWEFRDTDLDLKYCYNHEIPVLGTDESHPDLRTMEYIGPVIKKLLFESGIEIFNSVFGLIGKGKFNDFIKTSLTKDNSTCIQLSNLSFENERKIITECDAIIFADYYGEINYIGKYGQISAADLKKLNENIKIIYLCGQIDIEELKANGIYCHPNAPSAVKHMSVTTDYVGPKPLINLHTGGLKVGELMSKARLKGLSFRDTINEALKNPICLDFDENQKILYAK